MLLLANLDYITGRTLYMSLILTQFLAQMTCHLKCVAQNDIKTEEVTASNVIMS